MAPVATITVTEEQLQEMIRQAVEERLAGLRRELGQPEPGWIGAQRVWEAIRELAEAQRRNEEEIRAVAEAQRRNEEEIRALAEAQRRAEERLAQVEERLAGVEDRLARAEDRLARAEDRLAGVEDRLAQIEKSIQELAEAQRRNEEEIRALAEAQRRTEEALARLTQRVDQISLQLGQLANQVGLDIEVDAEETLRAVIEEKEFRMLQEPIAITMDGEVDLAVPVEQPTGERFWILVEVKGRLRRAELGKWLHNLQQPAYQERLRQAGVEKPFLPYIFGIRVYLGVEEMAREAGIGILTLRGERVAPRLWE